MRDHNLTADEHVKVDQNRSFWKSSPEQQEELARSTTAPVVVVERWKAHGDYSDTYVLLYLHGRLVARIRACVAAGYGLVGKQRVRGFHVTTQSASVAGVFFPNYPTRAESDASTEEEYKAAKLRARAKAREEAVRVATEAAFASWAETRARTLQEADKRAHAARLEAAKRAHPERARLTAEIERLAAERDQLDRDLEQSLRIAAGHAGC